MLRWFVVALAVSSCAAPQVWIPPPSEAQRGPADLVVLWVGRGECEGLQDGQWVRRPEFDYEFSVEQHRYGTHWESVKTLRRLHPGYDGSAGPRAQVYFFQLDAQPQGAIDLKSSLGDGAGTTDEEFRHATLELSARGVSSMAPFDTYRITQTYDYEGGALTELVELNKGATPWVRNREKAVLFGGTHFERAPTRLTASR